MLSDSSKIPNMFMLWDQDNHLIMANEKARRHPKKNGF